MKIGEKRYLKLGFTTPKKKPSKHGTGGLNNEMVDWI